MKKKGIVIGIILVAIVTVVSVVAFTLSQGQVVASMNQNHDEPNTSVSTVSFTGEEGGQIKFFFRSDVVSGELNMVLYDSQGNAVYKLDQAKALETYFTLEHADTYTLAAEKTDFVGNYKVKVFEVKK